MNIKNSFFIILLPLHFATYFHNNKNDFRGYSVTWLSQKKSLQDLSFKNQNHLSHNGAKDFEVRF